MTIHSHSVTLLIHTLHLIPAPLAAFNPTMESSMTTHLIDKMYRNDNKFKLAMPMFE